MSTGGDRRDVAAVRATLTTIMGDVLGRPVEIRAVELLKGGYSRQMWSFDAHVDGGAVRPLLLCLDAPTGVVYHGEQTVGRVAEGRLLTWAADAGVPVPGVVSAGVGPFPADQQYLVVERLEGTAAAGPFVRDDWYAARREAFAAQVAEILAGIHAAPIPSDLLGDPAPAADVAAVEVARWRNALDATPGAWTDVIQRAVGWLDRTRPAPADDITLVHGDYRIGNLLYDRGGIRAVLDWEMAHLGDPLEDVAWAQLVCWQLGTGRAGGLVEPERWVSMYAVAAGRHIDTASLHFWQVLGSVKMTVLAWRAIEITPEGRERDLLLQLCHLLADELERLLR